MAVKLVIDMTPPISINDTIEHTAHICGPDIVADLLDEVVAFFEGHSKWSCGRRFGWDKGGDSLRRLIHGLGCCWVGGRSC
jgi:hypothetical protein